MTLATGIGQDDTKQAATAQKAYGNAADVAPQSYVNEENNLWDQYYGVTPQQQQSLVSYMQQNPSAPISNTYEQQDNYSNAILEPDSTLDKVLQGIALAGTVGAITAGAGAVAAPAIGATGSVLGGTAGTVANGAIAGGVGGLAQGVLTGGNVGKDALVGALGGGLLGGINSSGLTTNAEGALTGAGLDNAAADAIVKGAEGAGVGALKGAITGNGAGNGALMGGATGAISGGVSGGIQDATGSAPTGIGAQVVNAGSGILASDLLSKYTTPGASQVSSPVAAPVATQSAAPAMSTTLPVQTTQATAPTAATPATTAPTNIGAYSGFNSTGLGYQPMSQVNPGISNYYTYGQGPQASFFEPTPGTT